MERMAIRNKVRSSNSLFIQSFAHKMSRITRQGGLLAILNKNLFAENEPINVNINFQLKRSSRLKASITQHYKVKSVELSRIKELNESSVKQQSKIEPSSHIFHMSNKNKLKQLNSSVKTQATQKQKQTKDISPFILPEIRQARKYSVHRKTRLRINQQRVYSQKQMQRKLPLIHLR